MNGWKVIFLLGKPCELVPKELLATDLGEPYYLEPQCTVEQTFHIFGGKCLFSFLSQAPPGQEPRERRLGIVFLSIVACHAWYSTKLDEYNNEMIDPFCINPWTACRAASSLYSWMDENIVRHGVEGLAAPWTGDSTRSELLGAVLTKARSRWVSVVCSMVGTRPGFWTSLTV